MSDWSPEKAIAMEKRHIVEGEMRIARQEAIVANLMEKGRGELLTLAEDLLSAFRESVGLSRERLLYLRNRYGTPPSSGSHS